MAAYGQRRVSGAHCFRRFGPPGRGAIVAPAGRVARALPERGQLLTPDIGRGWGRGNGRVAAKKGKKR
jgi:hypothetical protein